MALEKKMAASLSGVFSLQEFTDLGTPLVGGRVYTYTQGTTTHKTAYTDKAGSIAHTYTSDGVGGQYIGLNARGELPAPLYLVAGSYDITLKDSTGATIWTRRADPVDDTDAALRIDLASTSDAAKGDALIGVKRTDIASAADLTLHDWNNAARLNVRQVGVKGDGSTDDAALLNTLGALGVPLYIPYTSTGYKIGSSVTFNCDVFCEGTFNPTSAIGSAVNDYNRFAIILASGGYANKRKFVGIRVAGSVALRAANVSGIRNDCENSYLMGCHVYQLNYGIVARSYSQTYDKCNANQCNTNFDAYARSSSLEVNALTIIGGNYDSPVNRSMYLGDTTWSDAWGGSNYHGSVIQITGGANFDGGEVKIDWCTCVNIDTCYFETSATNYGLVLGSTDNSVRNITVKNCFFKTLRIAIKCLAAVNGIVVGRNFYTGVTHSALYCTSDLYFVEYHAGDATASFTLGKEFHTGFRSLAVASVTFAAITYPAQGIYRGRQTLLEDVGVWYPSGILQSGNTIKTNLASSACRYYTSPTTGKAGTVSGSTFTFTTASDAQYFNGGDAIVTSPAGAVYVRSVDYEAGTMIIDGGTTAAGAATVSQQSAVFFSRTVTYLGAAPSSGTWAKGDIADNANATVGQPKRWLCTVAGTPGTWVSEGNL